MPQCFPDIEPALFAEWVDAMLQQRPPLIVTDASLLQPPGITVDPATKDIDAETEKRIAPLQRMIDEDYVEVDHFENQHLSKLSILARKGGPYDPVK